MIALFCLEIGRGPIASIGRGTLPPKGTRHATQSGHAGSRAALHPARRFRATQADRLHVRRVRKRRPASLPRVALPLPLSFLSLPFASHSDYGYHNVGWRNPEMHTPTIDALARSGIILERHYGFTYCSPSRCSLLSVHYTHIQHFCPHL